MIEVFSWFATKIADALVGDAIKAIRNKPKQLGKALLVSRTRLEELTDSLDMLRVALAARRAQLDGQVIALDEGQLNPFVERKHYFFENQDVLAGAGIRLAGWRRAGRSNGFVPYFARLDLPTSGREEDETATRSRSRRPGRASAAEVSYDEFLTVFLDHSVRETYRSLQRAAVSLRDNLNAIADGLLLVAAPELYKQLEELAEGDYRLAYWIFESPPQISVDGPRRELSITLTTLADPKEDKRRAPAETFDHAASMPIEYADATIVRLDHVEDLDRGMALVVSLRDSIKTAADGIATCIRQNWKIGDLL
jgi:hypothetical protein